MIHSNIIKEGAIDRRLAAAKYVEIAAARRLSPAKNRGNRCCQTSVTSEKSKISLLLTSANSENSGKSLLPDRQIFLFYFFHKCNI